MSLMGPAGMPRFRGPCREHSLHTLDQFQPMLYALLVGGEARIVGQFLHAQAFHAAPELPIIANRQHQVAIARGERLVGNEVRMRRAEAPGSRAPDKEIHVLVPEPGEFTSEQVPPFPEWQQMEIPKPTGFRGLSSRTKIGWISASAV